jgi:O-acetyl-ADP-ribose deacetylase (regulator of RNase III)
MIEVSLKGCIIEAFKTKEYAALVHGCNCFCNMGAGLAKTVVRNYSSALKADQTTTYGDKTKLGTYSIAETKDGHIINAYTQFSYGGGKQNADYDAIRKVFEQINEDYKGKVICIPKIGCGLAKGNWKEVKKIINKATPDVEIDVYYI